MSRSLLSLFYKLTLHRYTWSRHHASCLLSNRLTITDMGTWAGIGERGFEFGTLGGQPKHKETLSEQQP